jgi:FdhE protein
MMRYPERERRRIAALRRRHLELSESLSFLEKVADAAGRLVTDDFDRSRLPQRVAGRPPLLLSRFPLDEPGAVEAFRTFLTALFETTGSGAAIEAVAALAEGRLDPRALVRAYCAGDAKAFERAAQKAERLDAELLVNLAELAVKPQFVAAARALDRALEKAPDRSDHCPVCGSHPDLALITDHEDSERTMLAVCRLCESEWLVRRVRCLHCGNEDSQTLSYLQAEGEEEARVYICELCHRYLPVLDVRGRPEVAPAVERTAVAHLDIVAQEHGAHPLTAFPAHHAG